MVKRILMDNLIQYGPERNSRQFPVMLSDLLLCSVCGTLS